MPLEGAEVEVVGMEMEREGEGAMGGVKGYGIAVAVFGSMKLM